MELPIIKCLFVPSQCKFKETIGFVHTSTNETATKITEIFKLCTVIKYIMYGAVSEEERLPRRGLCPIKCLSKHTQKGSIA